MLLPEPVVVDAAGVLEGDMASWARTGPATKADNIAIATNSFIERILRSFPWSFRSGPGGPFVLVKPKKHDKSRASMQIYHDIDVFFLPHFLKATSGRFPQDDGQTGDLSRLSRLVLALLPAIN
jgi:hypothetical protein